MNNPSVRSIETHLARYSEGPAPFLPMLHAVEADQGFLNEEALKAIAQVTGTPLAALYGTTSFYSFLRLDTRRLVGVCQGPACRLAGAEQTTQAVRRRYGIRRDGASADGQWMYRTISCPGLCDRPVAVMVAGSFLPEGRLKPAPVGPSSPIQGALGGRDVYALDPARSKALAHAAVKRAVHHLTPEDVMDTVKASGLLGRGGAGFSCGQKWELVRQAEGASKFVVCNADEGEPGVFKDRAILEHVPHILLAGMVLAGYAVGAAQGIIYIRYEYPTALGILQDAIAEATREGLLGQRVLGSDFSFQVHLCRGAGAYICGEETSLLNSLEGKRPWPRERPPYPPTQGLWGKPTAVNNVETLAAVPFIINEGPDRFHSLGLVGNAGTKLYSLSGRVSRPGNYELPLGTTARDLIFTCGGGIPERRALKAFTLGGISGGILGPDALDLPLDYRSPAQYGVALGSGGVVVLDETCCTVDFALGCLSFYEHESCGKCFPCRIGTVRLRERLGHAAGNGRAVVRGRQALEELEELADVVARGSACGLGPAAALMARCLVRYFRPELEAHLLRGVCPAELCPVPGVDRSRRGPSGGAL